MRGVTKCLTIASFFVSQVVSFSQIHRSLKSSGHTSLNLKPSQGNQLVAASEASFTNKEKSVTPNGAARVFLDKIFSLKVRSLQNQSNNLRNEIIEFPIKIESLGKDEEILYPIVGFLYVKYADNTSGQPLYKTLPSTHCSKKCDLAGRQGQNLPVYGWYSPVCYLGSIHCNDDIYCGKPTSLPHPSEL
mmetsp:Transcript_3479/g.4840  ORF Transcript_3479/g.4840 Transcript_3479/m.4840 type:complete len:189 (-) Transcript_3479:276-842(-)